MKFTKNDEKSQMREMVDAALEVTFETPTAPATETPYLLPWEVTAAVAVDGAAKVDFGGIKIPFKGLGHPTNDSILQAQRALTKAYAEDEISKKKYRARMAKLKLKELRQLQSYSLKQTLHIRALEYKLKHVQARLNIATNDQPGVTDD